MSNDSAMLATGGEADEATAAASHKLTDPAWAWAPYEPDAERAWNLRWAGHLYRRAAFGASWDELQQALADGPQQAVSKLLRPDADVDASNRAYDEYEASTGDSESTDALRAWWLRRMIGTPHPLLEKMTLFWHSYFATSNAKVRSSSLMRQHVQLLRGHALGSFEPLLQAISHDPAVLVSLGGDANRKARPNENYVRELVEQFSLGAGQCSGKDISEAARAFTGWFVVRNELRYIPREHDSGVKEILGHKGNWGSEDVVRIVLERPAAARFVVRKLYRWLISETDGPSDALIAPLAESFARGSDVARVVETMLRSNLFFSPVAYRKRVKSPVEFAVGIVHGLEGMVSTSRLGRDLAALGQDLYRPPTVKGWHGGRNWINNSTVLGRNNLALALLAGSKPYGDKLDPFGLAGRHGYGDPEGAGRFLLDLFLQGDLEGTVAEGLLRTAAAAGSGPSRWLRQFSHCVVTLPEFQLA